MSNGGRGREGGRCIKMAPVLGFDFLDFSA